MANDEHGMPVPDALTVLPVRIAEYMSECERYSHGKVVVDSSEDESIVAGLYAFGSEKNMKFFVHAANNIIECREIVRRLAEPQALSLNEMEVIIQDAARLWAKMKQEAGDGA